MPMMCILLILPGAAEAALKAEVDRDRIAIDETLTLTISKDSSSFFSKPDTALLEKDFRVVSTGQSSNTKIINGQMSSTVKWEMMLAPKRIGRLQIPPFEVGGEKSEQIWVVVEKSAPAKTRSDDDATIFIETEVDHDELRVQAQLIYTLRAYLSVQAQVQDPQPPDLPDALIEKLEDATYNKTVNGRAYKVFERKYAIFPQKSGEIEIPQAVVQVTVPTRRRFGGVFDFMDQGQSFQLRGNPHMVRVLEKAPEFPSSSVWLPTDNLTLGEKWSRNPGELKVGESVTLTIDIFGAGLLAAQLPPVVIPETEGIKMYQNQGETENNISSRGVVGHRTETVALIPTRPGVFKMPEIRIPWWDKAHHEVKYAVVPARELTVTGAAVHEEASPPPVEQPGPVVAEEGNREVPEDTRRPLFWMAAFGFAVFLWLITLIFLIIARRKLAVFTYPIQGGGRIGNAAQHEAEGKLYRDFENACRENDPRRIRDSVLAWANGFWPEKGVRTFADLKKAAPDPGLATELDTLEAFLYGKGSGLVVWEAKQIREGVRRVRQKKSGGAKEEVLPTLYK
ncbi:MAG: BatD family protein [Proteobacteria bacterium]|nr:BatD family protein [Pseudomonadota bacterium]MBU1736710.1 BatD family protein [Pseudomonadota bacterium]